MNEDVHFCSQFVKSCWRFLNYSSSPPNRTKASAGAVFSEDLPVMHPVLINNDCAFWFNAAAGVTFRTPQGSDTTCLWIEMIREVFSHETVFRLVPLPS
jgi:hypothetical protein